MYNMAAASQSVASSSPLSSLSSGTIPIPDDLADLGYHSDHPIPLKPSSLPACPSEMAISRSERGEQQPKPPQAEASSSPKKRRFTHAFQKITHTAISKKPKRVDRRWAPDFVLTNEKSPLADADLRVCHQPPPCFTPLPSRSFPPG